MPSTASKLIVSDLGIRGATAGTWFLFAISMLALDWHDAALIHRAILTVGLIGFALSIAWLIRGGRWRYACLVMSIALLACYGIWSLVQIANHYQADPTSGLTGALTLQIRVWSGVLNKRFADGYWLGGAAEFYWLIGMPIVQAAIVAVIVVSSRSGNLVKSR